MFYFFKDRIILNRDDPELVCVFVYSTFLHVEPLSAEKAGE